MPRRVAIILLPLLLAGCAREEKLVRYKPWFAGLEGAEINRQVAIPGGLRSDPTGGLPEDQIRVERDDKSVELLAKTGRQLMIHIYTTLAEDERDLFAEQVLSDQTRGEYRAQGLDPALAFDALKQREDDVIDFFNAVPYAENTPGVFWKPLGGRAFRVEASGLSRTGLKVVAMDMIMERGNWKLRWFVPAPGEAGIAAVPEK
jgi:hypothetical protein